MSKMEGLLRDQCPVGIKKKYLDILAALDIVEI
jgi:hypothetical protein